MKVKIDGELCSGHGRCWVVAKEFYKLDDNGYKGVPVLFDPAPHGDAPPTMSVPAGKTTPGSTDRVPSLNELSGRT